MVWTMELNREKSWKYC